MAVVVGATEVIGPPSRLVMVGVRWLRDWSCSQPNPSRTSSTTCSASRNGPGSQSGRASGEASKDGASESRHGPP